MYRAVAILALVLGAQSAAACPQGAKCLTVTDAQKTGRQPVAQFLQAKATAMPFDVGDTIPSDKVNVLLNTDYHGLPPSDGSFWYVREGRHVYRMDPATLAVLEYVTALR